MPKIPRSEVYDAIDSERDYQDTIWGAGLSQGRDSEPEMGGFRSVDEFALYLQGYVNDLVAQRSKYASTETALDTIRKITALGVHCMEWHGAPLRKT